MPKPFQLTIQDASSTTNFLCLSGSELVMEPKLAGPLALVPLKIQALFFKKLLTRIVKSMKWYAI